MSRRYDPTDAEIIEARADLDEAIADLNLDHHGALAWTFGAVKGFLGNATDWSDRQARAACIAHDQWTQERRTEREEAGL